MTGRRTLRASAVGTVVVVLAALVLAADQFTKYLVVQHLPYGEPVHIIGDALIFFRVTNSGAAFSIGAGVTWVFTIALTVVALVIIGLAGAKVRTRSWAIILGLLLGGVLGNLSDRLLREPGFAVGHVVDFINVPWLMPATFNVADMFITTMMIGVAILVLMGVRLDGSREKHEKKDASADA